jgi:hypothetical protein
VEKAKAVFFVIQAELAEVEIFSPRQIGPDERLCRRRSLP